MDHIRHYMKIGFMYFCAAAVFAGGISQLGSYLINETIAENDTRRIFPYLYFTHIRNHGGIFGVAEGKGWIFGLVSLIFIGGLVWWVKRYPMRRWENICVGLIVGGGLSNVLDRVIYGSVIDFIDVKGIPNWYFIFNTADLLIHIGIWPMLIMSFFISELDVNNIPQKKGYVETVSEAD